MPLFDHVQGPKHERQLYVGNLPLGINPNQLVILLNKTLLIMKKYCYLPGLPVLSAWIAQDGHYGFVEFRNAVEMENALVCLGQMSVLNNPLKVGKTKH